MLSFTRIILIGAVVVATAPRSSRAPQLPAAGTVRGLIYRGASRFWTVPAASGQLITLHIDQSSADLGAILRDPRGQEIGWFDFSQLGPEPIEFIAPYKGNLGLELRVIQSQKPVVDYAIEISSTAAPTDSDRNRIHAENLVSEARRTIDRNTEGGLDHAIPQLREAISILDGLPDPPLRAAARMAWGDAISASGKYAAAADVYAAAATAARASEFRMYGEAVNKEGLARLNLGEPEAAGDAFEAAFQIWQKADFRYGLMIVRNNRALLKTRTGEWNDAFLDYQSILASPELTDQRLRAAVENNLGLTYEAVASWPEAREHFRKAAALWKAIANTSNEARALTNAARIRLLEGKPASGLPEVTEAVGLLRNQKDPGILAAALNVRGQIRRAVSAPSEAESDLRGAVDLYRRTGDRRGLASALYQSGLLLTEEGRAEEAGRDLRESLDLRTALELRDEQATTLNALARLDSTQDRFDAAAARLESALTLVETLRTSLAAPRYRMTYLSERHRLYEDLADIYTRQNRLDEALRTIERGRARQWLDDLHPAWAPAALQQRRFTIEKNLNFKLDQLVRSGSLPETSASANLLRQVQNLIEDGRNLDLELGSFRVRQQLAEPRLVGPDEIPAMLPSETAMLYYAMGDRTSHLYVITRAGIESFELPARSELNRIIARFARVPAGLP